MSRPASLSPSNKRHRLSSPTYDNQVEEMTQEDLAALDAIELRLSQQPNASTSFKRPRLDNDGGSSKPPRHTEWGSSQEPPGSFPGFAFAGSKRSAPADDPDNPFTAGFTSAAKVAAPAFKVPTMVGFASASKLPLQRDTIYERSPSPEEPPPEPDLDSWFNPAPVDIPTASFATPAFASASAMVGFKTAASKDMILPSKEALAKAKAKLDAWNKELDESENQRPDENTSPTKPISVKPASKPTGFTSASSTFAAQTPQRVAFQSVANILNSPTTPSPAGFSRPSVAGSSKAIPSPNFQRPQFKTPSIRQPHTPNAGQSFGSPLNPKRSTASVGFTSATSQHPLAAPPLTAPRHATPQPLYNDASSYTTPLRPKIAQPVIKTTPTPFKTPFKPGMRPGEPGHAALIAKKSKTPLRPATTSRIIVQPNQVQPLKGRPPPKQRKEFFNLTPPPDRKTLSESGLRPQQYDIGELQYFGINTAMLSQITPETAMYYTFHTTASTPPPPGYSSPPVLLGPAEALKELLDRGCTLATKPWVDNHWCLILWKLAGMVGLDPEKETKPDETKWCWPEVIRQLLYRYEKELNGGSRPPLRKIANQDAPAAFPMVLCVSNIFWSPAGVTEDGSPIEPHPELEVTDGWYRLCAQIDLPMARAVRTGVIRIGRKIGVAGARLSTEKKDASEILEAYNSTKLIFSGNSSHLMPWHAKLGFTRGPCISTLHSLSHDGGFVAALDLVIVEAFPVAFLETKEDENGIKRHDGIRNEIEENEVNEKWRRRYEMEASKLREQYDKKLSRYDGYAERLERKAAGRFNPDDEVGPPDSIDSLYDELEYPNTAASLITRISATEAGWLAQHIRKQTETSRERMGEEIEQEMRTICPPRNVMSFRVLIVQDARTLRRPAHRVAQLTVWDVMGLSFGSEEDGGKRGGGFEVGQRFLVTHVNPTQASSWMGNEPGAQVFLSTSRHTRWTKIPVAKV